MQPKRIGNIGGHGESFNGRVLLDYLHKKGARIIRQPGTSHIRVELPNGRRVGAVPPSDPVASSLIREIARALGMTYPELRADMGHPIPIRNKPRFKVAEPPPRIIGRGKTIESLNAIIDEAERLKAQIYNGDRDPAIYERIHTAACGALKELTYFRATTVLIQQQAEGG